VGDRDGLRGIYLALAKSSLVVMMPVGLFLGFFGESIIRLWVGEANFVGVGVLLVLIAMNVFHAIGTPAAMMLQSAGRNRELMYSELLNAALNLVLSIVLIRRFGVIGAPLGTLIAHVLSSFWVVLLLPCRSMRVPVLSYLRTSVVPPVLAGLVSAGILFAVMPLTPVRSLRALTIDGVALLAVYLFVYLVIGSTRDERRLCLRWLAGLMPLRARGSES